MKIVLIRQRPAIGDALLLSPLILAIKEKYPKSHLTVITDAEYASGALPIIFDHIPGVDAIECISMHQWSTFTNVASDASLRNVDTHTIPETIKSADRVYDCNAAFINFERAFNGNPPMGISEFWLDLYGFGHSPLPVYKIRPEEQDYVDNWLPKNSKPFVGIVPRAGHPARDWNYNAKALHLAVWLHDQGYNVVNIDSHIPLNAQGIIQCISVPISFTACVVKQCDFVITPDTGILHLAQAVGTPQIALWGIMRPELRVKDYNCTLVPKESLGYCTDGHCWEFQRWSCMKRITLDMIADGINTCVNALPKNK